MYFAPTSHGGLTTSRTVLDALDRAAERRARPTRSTRARPRFAGARESAADLKADASKRDDADEERMGQLLRQIATRERVVPTAAGAAPAGARARPRRSRS